MPAEVVEFGNIGEFAHGAIGFGGIKIKFTFETCLFFNYFRACYEITAPFMLVLLLANFVKKPRRSSTMPVFFASLLSNIISTHHLTQLGL